MPQKKVELQPMDIDEAESKLNSKDRALMENPNPEEQLNPFSVNF